MSPESARTGFREAAVVVLVRGHGADLETYWVRRSDAVPVQPGFHAFLGGKVDAEDARVEMPGVADPLERAARVCAIREAFEEAGVLVALRGREPADVLAAARRRLLAGEVRFAELVAERGWSFDSAAIAPAGRWQTPPFASARFDTLYFLARVPEGQEPSIVPGELAEGEWVRPAPAIERWRRGEATFVAPILWTLRAIAEGEQGLEARVADAPRRAGQPVRRIEMQHGVVLHPMRTRPLPPATHTNAYLIGERDMVLLDPGSADREELDALFALTDALEREEGRRVTLIVATHHHADHSAGVAACRERFRAPVAGMAALADAMSLDRVLADGETITLAAKRGAWTLEALATPGHTRDSLSLWWPRNRALFCGDLIPGGSGTVIIDPPDGDLAQYMASLERIAALAPETLFPAHGSPQGAAVRRVRGLIAHRNEREGRVLAALAAEAQSLDDLLPRVYADVRPDLWPHAARSLLAHLLKLERDGRAARDGERWRRA